MVSTPLKSGKKSLKVRSTGPTKKALSGPPISEVKPLPAPKLKHRREKFPPTEQQKSAIAVAASLQAGEGLAIIANAGCGKTELASMIVTKLIEAHGDPDIIVTSFTTKAVSELKDRLPKSRNTRVQTFSSLCLNVLKSSGFEVDIEFKADSVSGSKKPQTKSSKLSGKVAAILTTSETINAQYLKAINFGAWEIRQYADGAAQRNGYNHRKKTVDIKAIRQTEKSVDRQINIIEDLNNRKRFVSVVKPLLTNLIFEKLIEDQMHPDIGFDSEHVENIQNQLIAQDVSFQLGKDTAEIVKFLCEYLLRLSPVDLNSSTYQFSWDMFFEAYDEKLEAKGIYEVMEGQLSDDEFNNLPLCAGSILADEQVQVFLASDLAIGQLVDIKRANENVYGTVALLAEKYIAEGLETAKKEGVFTYNELMLCCRTFPVNEIWPRYILIDEAQDLSPLQHTLLSRFVSAGTSLIIIGDPNQAIFEWAGAASDSYEKLIARFNCKVMPLSQSFRCAKNIIEYAQKYVAEIECGNDRLGVITVTDDWMFKGQYLKGDLVLARTRLDATRAYFNFMRGANTQLNDSEADAATVGYGSGLNLTGAVKEVTRRCKADGRPIEELWGYVNAEINVLFQAVKEGKTSAASRDVFEKLSMVKMMFQTLKEGGNMPVFYSDNEFVKRVEKEFPTYKTPPADKECVRFLTVHKAKGSEGDRCIVIDAPKFLPPPKTLPAELTEEQRLSYVMVTRAKNELILCGGHPMGESAQGRNAGKKKAEKAFFGEAQVPENASSYRF